MAKMGLAETVTDKTVTPEWLNAKLGIATIESIKVQRIGEDIGHTDLVYRVHLSYKNDDNARSTRGKLDTIVMKVMDASTGHRTAFEPLNTREVRFYSEIAPLLNLDSIPTCYHAYFDKETLKGNILLEDAGKAIHEGELQTATAAQAKKTMAELGRLHGTSLTKMSEIPADMPRPLEPDDEEMRKAFPAFAKTWRTFLGEEGLKRYERAVDAYEKKWLVQKDGFVQGVVHGDYRIGNVIFGREGPEDRTQDQTGQDDDARDFAENIKVSIAQRHLAKAGGGTDAAQSSLKTTSNERVEEAAGGTLENPGGLQITRSASQPEKAPKSNIKNPIKTEDTGSRSQPSSAASSNDDISKLKFRHVDWQTVSRGPIFADVAYFLSISLDSKTRHACEVDLLYAWYTACREAAGELFPADLNITRCVHEISIACIKAVLISVTTLNNLQAPEMAMRILGGKLNMVSQILVDWRSLD
jgi:Ecdysteroid kinase-like family